MPYIFLNKVQKVIIIVSGGSLSLGDYHLFPALSQNLDCHRYNVDCEEETSVTRWVINQYSDFLSAWDIQWHFMKQVPQLWREFVER